MKTRRPNLLYVLADQLGRNHCGYAGACNARTPRIDRLATEGVSFTNAISNTPVCAAYRASLFTGKYTTSTGMVINELRMNPNQECMGHLLSQAGYETGYIGKWHLYGNEMGNHGDVTQSFVPPGPHRLGFDGYWAAYNFNHVYYDSCYHANTPERIYYGPGVYEPDGQTDLAIRFLESSRAADQPFALVVSYGTPHDPWTPDNVPVEFLREFERVRLPNPPNYLDRNDPYGDGWATMNTAERASLEAWRHVYCAMTANLDWNIGRLSDALDRLGLAGETVFLFTSDHGEMFGAHGRAAKNIFYEEAARIPLLLRMPGRVPAGRVSDACIGTVDIMPTLFSLMGLPPPSSAEGMDLGSAALGLPGPEPEAALLQNTGACAIWEDGHEWRALRDKRHTYAIYRADRSELLFDNIEDPWQLRNLAGDPRYQAVIDRFRSMLDRKMSLLNDTFEACTWYRDHWTRDRVIIRSATMNRE